jgi:hypothetical protein
MSVRRFFSALAGVSKFRAGALAALALFAALLTIVAQVAIDNPMSTARDGAVAVALKDGRILAIGGKDATGAALDTAEFIGAGSALASKLSSPRTGHIAVTLNDGRVLVAGGRNAQGAVVNTTEIFNPISETFSLASSSMLEARAGATATLLEDGRVFIAGGEGPGGVLASTEIFDPATGQFSPGAPMSTPRRGHAAAEASEIVLKQDHRVVIAGGNNGAADLASIELYDHVTNAMSVFPAAMANPRAGLTATPLLKGQILLAGGSIAGSATAATEILNLPSATLAPGPAMSQPRSGHFSTLLPDNNTVLMAGGATSSPAAEIFVSWQNQFRPSEPWPPRAPASRPRPPMPITWALPASAAVRTQAARPATRPRRPSSPPSGPISWITSPATTSYSAVPASSPAKPSACSWRSPRTSTTT